MVSCRGIKAGQSFSFLEVIVGCEMAEGESISNHKIEYTEGNKNKTIYLHLKKFFRGTRFTFQPFLRSIQNKYKEGEIVCVSGKVSSWVCSVCWNACSPWLASTLTFLFFIRNKLVKCFLEENNAFFWINLHSNKNKISVFPESECNFIFKLQILVRTNLYCWSFQNNSLDVMMYYRKSKLWCKALGNSTSQLQIVVNIEIKNVVNI